MKQKTKFNFTIIKLFQFLNFTLNIPKQPPYRKNLSEMCSLEAIATN